MDDTIVAIALALFGITLIAFLAFKPKNVIIERDSNGNITAIRESW
ncbi:MAG: hypothetical protein JTT12_05545 [Candidatus Brockarchaeota archaeon]|nr:hypothetical protein [Candidatus Brockarchaeota archaeon]